MSVPNEIPIILVSMIILISFSSTAISAQSMSPNSIDACTMQNTSVPVRILISTDRQQYSPGQVVQIFGNVSQGKPINEMLNLNILDPSKKSIGAEQTCVLGGRFSYNLTNTQQEGTYTIIASMNGLTKSTTTISVMDLIAYATYGLINTNRIPLLVASAGLIFTVILVVILLWLPGRVTAEFTRTEKRVSRFIGKKEWKPSPVVRLFAENWLGVKQNVPDDKGAIPTLPKKDDNEKDSLVGRVMTAYHELYEVERNLQRARTWRFICITGMVLSLITIYAFTPLEVGVDSSLGLVKIHDANNKAQWVINIGGTRESNYTGGLHVPWYVFVFGILGGYLRYLYTTAYPEKEEEIPKKPEELLKQFDKAKDDTDQFLITTVKQLALIVLAPLLAIAVWFVVSGQGQTYTNVAILAALSLAIGLVTKEVVDGLISFAKGRIPGTPTPAAAPLANAGPNQAVRQGFTVTLDGTGSHAIASGATIASYSWVQTAEPWVTLRAANTARPEFTAPQQSTSLTFSLTVRDSTGAVSSPSTVTVTVT
jgi:hypothetical protein